MRYLVRCGLKIGDTLMQFPALKYLADRGHSVFVYGLPEYRTLFELISYATWVESPVPESYDRYLDLQLYPDRLPALNQSRMSPLEFTYQLYPDIHPANRSHIVLDIEPRISLSDYGLEENQYHLVSPFGYSQVFKPTLAWMLKKFESIINGNCNIYVLSDKPVPESPYPVVVARQLSHLPSLIRGARTFFTTNSSPSIFASVVRGHYYHLFNPDWRGTHDWKSPKQTVIYHDEWPLFHA